MPASSMETMLEAMIMNMLEPTQNISICCNCFKMKKTTNPSRTSSKCIKSCTSTGHKKRRRKRKKSSFKTIMCVSKLAKNLGECQECSCGPSCHNTDEHGDERFCAKCGQILPGIEPADLPMVPGLYVQQLEQCQQRLEYYQQQLQRYQREHADVGVQVNMERKEPLSVHIKVCPCPNKTGTEGQKLHHSVSDPELSRTNPRLVEEATSENFISTRVSGKRLVDDYTVTSAGSHFRLNGLDEAIEQPTDIGSIKRLALKMAKARLAEEAVYWEGERSRRGLEQSQPINIDGLNKDRSSPMSEQTTNDFRGPGILERSCLSGEAKQANSRPMDRISILSKPNQTPTYTNYTQQQDPEKCREPPCRNFDAFTLGNSVVCCGGSKAYCYNPEIPSLYGDHCEHEIIKPFQPDEDRIRNRELNSDI